MTRRPRDIRREAGCFLQHPGGAVGLRCGEVRPIAERHTLRLPDRRAAWVRSAIIRQEAMQRCHSIQGQTPA